MGRLIPATLKSHLNQDATTTCYLVRVESVQPGYPVYGVTSLDKAVYYDDGRGFVNYSAAIGVQPTVVQASSDLAVDNAEATSLMPEFDIPVSEADIRAGAYDFARFDMYLVNYEDLSQGHTLIHSGTIGRITINDDGLSFVNEMRGLSAELKQSICEKDSLTCRAIFGSQPESDSSGAPVERFPCGVDATALLISGTVTSVGIENTLNFTVAPFTLDEDELNPGIVLWTTGLNAGRTYEIDTNTSGGLITLAIETAWPIQIGDQLLYRQDCNKQARDEEKGCAKPDHWGTEWPLHFRGEPDIPIGDAGQMETPGASSSPGSGGATYQPFVEAE